MESTPPPENDPQKKQAVSRMPKTGSLNAAFEPRVYREPEGDQTRRLAKWFVPVILTGVAFGTVFLLLENRFRFPGRDSQLQVAQAESGKAAAEQMQEGEPKPAPGSDPMANSVDALRARATEFVTSGDIFGAFKLYERVEESGALPSSDTERARFYMDAGSAALLAGYPEKALEFFQQSVGADPAMEGGKALNNCAYLLAKNPGDLVVARKFAERALAISPAQPEFLDTLATIQLAEEDLEGAIATMRQAEKLSAGLPSHPRISEKLGDLLISVSERDEAILFWRKAAAENPMNDRLWNKIADHGR